MVFVKKFIIEEFFNRRSNSNTLTMLPARRRWPRVDTFRCPIGFERTNEWATSCFKSFKSCPEGFERRTWARNVCEPKRDCPEGFAKHSQYCVQVPKCPEGFKKEGHVCVIKCPKGWVKYNNSLCAKIQQDCPAGFRLINSYTCYVN